MSERGNLRKRAKCALKTVSVSNPGFTDPESSNRRNRSAKDVLNRLWTANSTDRAAGRIDTIAVLASRAELAVVSTLPCRGSNIESYKII